MSNYKKISDKIEELIIDNPKTEGQTKWVNITNAGQKELNYLRRTYKFELPHLRATSPSVSFQRPMIFKGDSYICLILHFPCQIGDNIFSSEVDFFIGHGFLVTSHNDNISALGRFFNTGKKSPDSLLSYSLESSAILLYEILGNLSEDTYQLLDGISLKINEIEEHIFSHKQKEAVIEILTLRRSIINVRRIIQNHKNIFKQLTAMESAIVDKAAINKYYNSLVEQSKRIWETLDNQKEIVDVLYNTNESLLNNHMTDIMKTLTIFSVIVFPLTLLAAVFGMNVPEMPLVNLHYGFWWIALLMLLGATGMMLIFHKKRWL
jgi:magnesium transporter